MTFSHFCNIFSKENVIWEIRVFKSLYFYAYHEVFLLQILIMLVKMKTLKGISNMLNLLSRFQLYDITNDIYKGFYKGNCMSILWRRNMSNILGLILSKIFCCSYLKKFSTDFNFLYV